MTSLHRLAKLFFFPKIADDVIKTAGWIDDLIAGEEANVSIELPKFGEPIELY